MLTSTSNERVFNFSPGPAVLPESVLRQAQQELLALPGVGASVLEISHRGEEFRPIHEAAKANLTALLQLPPDYQVLFLQGGARLQFAMVPMNLGVEGGPARYIVNGSWGLKALQEARLICAAEAAYDGKDTGFTRLPTAEEVQVHREAAYLHFTSNETIEGVQFLEEPAADGVPLVCDASSDFLCRPLPIERYGLIYACAQKNAGPSGVTIVIIRKDLLERSGDRLPGYLNYRLHAENDSLYNTPPTFGIYMVGLVAQWLRQEIGGLDRMYALNREKARLLYDVLEEHPDVFRGHAQPGSRSIMNVTFRLPNEELQRQFVTAARERRLHHLKGHRSVGGIRASIYNAMPLAGVLALRDFMREFAAAHGS